MLSINIHLLGGFWTLSLINQNLRGYQLTTLLWFLQRSVLGNSLMKET